MRVKKTLLASPSSYFGYFCRGVDGNSWECLLCRTLLVGARPLNTLTNPTNAFLKYFFCKPSDEHSLTAQAGLKLEWYRLCE